MNLGQGPTPAEMVAEYIKLREGKRLAEERYKGWKKAQYDDRMDELEKQLLNTLNTLGLEHIASPDGTVYKKLTTSVTVADPREFRRHVIGSEQWDLIDWRANKTAVNEIVEQGGTVPGINRSAFYSVGIRKSS